MIRAHVPGRIKCNEGKDNLMISRYMWRTSIIDQELEAWLAIWAYFV